MQNGQARRSQVVHFFPILFLVLLLLEQINYFRDGKTKINNQVVNEQRKTPIKAILLGFQNITFYQILSINANTMRLSLDIMRGPLSGVHDSWLQVTEAALFIPLLIFE